MRQTITANQWSTADRIQDHDDLAAEHGGQLTGHSWGVYLWGSPLGEFRRIYRCKWIAFAFSFR